MNNGGNLGDQEIAAREAAQPHRRVVVRNGQQRLAAPRVFNVQIPCPFCRTMLRDDHLLAHLEICPGALNNPEKALAITHEFCSNERFLRRQLWKLRKECELGYLKAKLDRRELASMACRLCKSYADHLAGKCMSNRQKAVFYAKANKIAAKVLLHYEQTLNLKKKIAINRLDNQHAHYFDSIEDRLSAEPTDLDAWFEFDKHTKEQHVKKSKLINALDSENHLQFERYKTSINERVEKVANAMSENFASSMRNFRQLRQIVRRAFPAGEQVGQDAQEPPSRMSEGEASQLEEFFANFKVSKISSS